jgi:hypothetical protein
MKDYPELYEERAGIMEFDGGLTKEEAEKRALLEINSQIITDYGVRNSETYNIIRKTSNIINKPNKENGQ